MVLSVINNFQEVIYRCTPPMGANKKHSQNKKTYGKSEQFETLFQ